MEKWDNQSVKTYIDNIENFSRDELESIVNYLNENFPIDRYEKENTERKMALEELENTKNILNTHVQKYPSCYELSEINFNENDLNNIAFFFTAGGEGQRLRQSIEKNGKKNEVLENFTKATYPIQNFPENFGTLMINLALIKSFCDKYKTDIPVIISLGPKNSTTYNYIPSSIEKFKNFGLKNLFYIAQKERLHLTDEGKITINKTDNGFKASTNPDETGGPFMAFQKDKNLVEKIRQLGIQKLLCIQGIGIYNPEILLKVASSNKEHDCYILGLPRENYPETDCFGTLVVLENEGKKQLRILESHMINNETRTLKSSDSSAYLPANSGLYVFDLSIFEEEISRPFYATSAKEIEASKKLAPKIGYSATDFSRFSKNPAVLLVQNGNYSILKNIESLDDIEKLGKKFELDIISQKVLSDL